MPLVFMSQDNSRAPGSPTSLRVPPSGGCEDLDMETEEEDELRARGEVAVQSVAGGGGGGDAALVWMQPWRRRALPLQFSHSSLFKSFRVRSNYLSAAPRSVGSTKTNKRKNNSCCWADWRLNTKLGN